jgi:hypothetical protein
MIKFVKQGITAYKSERSASFSQDKSYKLNRLEARTVPVFLHVMVKGNSFFYELTPSCSACNQLLY